MKHANGYDEIAFPTNGRVEPARGRCFEEIEMKVSDYPKIPGGCVDCMRRTPDSFCNLTEPALTDLQSIRSESPYSRGTTIFLEGQPARGVYLLCSGRVKLSTYSEQGKAIILRFAEPGELLGLSAVIASTPHEKTARAVEDCSVSFIKKRDFVDLVQKSHDATLNALRQLSRNYQKAHMQICSLGLSSSVGDKLARLLVQWCNGGPREPARITRTHTHGEIAEMIGTSRETVTRLLNDFRDRGLITFSRAELCIPDPQRLLAAVGGRHRKRQS